MEECCDICGDAGVPAAIRTCRQCKTNCAHIYCMKVIFEEVPEDGWTCEECESVPNPLPEPAKRRISFNLSLNQVHVSPPSSQKSPGDPRKKPLHWENKPKKPGKTMYITAEEAIQLTASSTTPSASSRLSSPPRPNAGPNRKRTPLKPKTVPLSSIYQQHASSVPLQQCKPQGHNHASPSRQQSKEPSEVKRPAINPFSAKLPSDKYACIRKENPSEIKSHQAKMESEFKRPWLNVQPAVISEVQKPRNAQLSAQVPSNEYAYAQKVKPSEVTLPRRKEESVIEKRSSAVMPRLNVPPLTESDSRSSTIGCNGGIHVGQSIHGIHEEQSYTDGNSNKASYAPAMVVWKGIFNIRGFLEQGNLRHEIQAHLPSQTHCKVFEFSKRLPELLDAEMVPCDNIWLKLFPEYIPDGRDIGLYLFPNQHQSSDDYSSLLNYMNTNNYALRMQIADVELLVFSSTLLPKNCQFWELKNFLWGVFHRVKGNTKTDLKPEGVVSSVRLSEDANNSQEDGIEETDMEIDMIGGVTVGRVDVAVQGESPGNAR